MKYHLHMIDLAPTNPYASPLRSPILVAAGCAVRDVNLARVGAIVTRPTTVHTRGLPPPTWSAVPSGVVYSHLPSVSVRVLLRDEARRWSRSPAPVWVHLLGTAHDIDEMLVRLAPVDDIAGFVVESEDADIVRVLATARRGTLLPLWAMLPLRPDLADLAQAATAAGSDALVIAQPPPAAAWQGQTLVQGRLWGPAVIPQVVAALAMLAPLVTVPLIAQGGVGDAPTARQYLAVGATAVLVDAARWGDPLAPNRVVEDGSLNGSVK